MPARTRKGHSSSSAATTTEPAGQDQDQEQDQPEGTTVEDAPEGGALRKLQFNEPISWRVGRSAIPIADLLQRLQTLAQELRKLEQEEVDPGSLTKVSQELATPQLLAHKDKGVRAWAACCIVDVLRLCAPDAPFTANQLKDFFTCTASSIIPSLADPSHPYNAQHIYVLNSLAEVKSIVLMTDLDQPDSLIVPLFTTCFDIVSGSSKASTGEEIAKNVEFDMTRLLVTVIDETPVLAPEVVDVIVAQFLRVDPRALENPSNNSSRRGKKADAPPDSKQGTLLLKDYPAAYNMSKAICQACPERMTSHISQYFNNVIIDASAPGANGSKPSNRRQTLDDSDEEAEDFKELSKAHRLIRELWRACPEVLQNVVPQLEAELSAEAVSLRLLATQTIGDLTAGIGVAGPPPPPPMDPAAYPPVTLSEYSQMIPQTSVLVTPLSPKPFSQVYSSTYDGFISRRLDKSASVRAAWATVVGRILLTSAGGSGLSESEERTLIQNLAAMLRDADERVRVAAVDVLGTFGLSHVVYKLGFNGGFSSENSVLAILAERVKDRKPHVREHAMKVLARMWAVAAGEIEQNNEQVVSLLKEGPSKVFEAFYTNDPDIHVMIDKVLFELLVPLTYPPIKPKLSRSGSSQSQKQKDSQSSEDGERDVDKIRARRILTLLAGLDDKAKKVFFAMQARQLNIRTLMTMYLQACEDYNGGVVEKDEARVKAQLSRMIDATSKAFPDASRASADLWKFAKVHDRRNYQLIRFAMAAATDYRTVIKALKELTRRVQNANNTPLLDTFMPLLYRSSSLIFNRSHIPAIMSLSRTDEGGLANPAQEMLREISSRNPAVLEAQIQEMCQELETQAPTATASNDAGTEEILKACSGFAKKLPEKLPKERQFLQSLTNYALYSSSPRAAKHAVTILMATAEKREMYAKDLVDKCVADWKYGTDKFLTKLATLSKLNHLAPREADEESDAIVSIAIDQILLMNRSPKTESGYKWSETVDEETAAKEWALKIIVNRLRVKKAADDETAFRAQAEPVYSTLNKLVVGEGELSKKKDTPTTQKPRLRLLAAKSLLKLCASHSLCDHLLSPQDFNAISLVAQDRIQHVRSGFIEQLKKKLVQNSHLSHRWYIIPCLLAFEPDTNLKDNTLTWLRSRAAYFSQQVQASGKRSEQQMVMESIFSRLLSLLAYHPDYPPTDLDESTKLDDLTDFARYILFYLTAIGNENNLSLIFHVAQRVKQTRDGITKSDEISTRLHALSDLAQATIRRFAEIYAQQHRFGGASGGTNILQTYPGRMGVSSSLFAPMGSHREAQEVAEKSFLPENIEDTLDRLVRAAMKPRSSAQGQAKKRKSVQDANGGSAAATSKKSRKDKPTTATSTSRRTSGGAGSSARASKSKKKRYEDGWSSDGDEAGGTKAAATSGARRRSGRGASSSKRVSYADRDSDEDDMEMDEWDQADEDGQEDDDNEEGNDNDEHEKGDDNGEEQDDEQEEPAEASSTPPPTTTTTTTTTSKRQGKAPAKEPLKTIRGTAASLPTRKSSRR